MSLASQLPDRFVGEGTRAGNNADFSTLVNVARGNADSAGEESFSDGLLEYPHFTKPAEFREMTVPDVLRSGDHARVARWRHAQALVRTMGSRPDLMALRGGLSPHEQALLEEFGLGD